MLQAKLRPHARGKPFYSELVGFITSGPVVAMVIEEDGAVKVVRQMIGATNPRDAKAGTIRGDFALSSQKNVIHASDSLENGRMEIDIFFSVEELLTYNRSDESWIY
jgi:nucleoside-diphosphate kinase